MAAMEGTPHLCAECGKGFDSSYKLQKHMMVHITEKNFLCPDCGKVFKRENYLIKHQKRHTDRPYRCHICGKGCTDLNSLEEHKLGHTGEQAHVCPDCGRGFNQLGNMRKHRLTHSKVMPYPCPLCGKKFRDKSNLNRHKQNFHREKVRHVCSVCNKECSNLPNLERHMASHREPKPRVCPICDTAFVNLKRLRTHMRKTHNAQTEATACPDCGKSFHSKKYLKKHMKMHTGESPHVCTDCDERFPGQAALRRHMIIHRGDKPYECSDCGQGFSLVGNLRRHILVHTTEKKDTVKQDEGDYFPYVCTKCGKGFSQSSKLKTHMGIHRRIRMSKRYVCSECGKGFAAKGSLKAHVLTHTGEKPHLCLECGRRFLRAEQLKSHMKMHTGETPYACEKCNKRFKHKYGLKYHISTHDAGKRTKADKPHVCSDCGLGFMGVVLLNKHTQDIHGQSAKVFTDPSDLKPDIDIKLEETEPTPLQDNADVGSELVKHGENASSGDDRDGGADFMNHYDSDTDVDEMPDLENMPVTKVKSEIPTEAELAEMFPPDAREAYEETFAESHEVKLSEMRAMWYQAAVMRKHVEPWAAGIQVPPQFLTATQDKVLLEKIAKERKESALRIMEMTKDYLGQVNKEKKDNIEVSYCKVESLTSLNRSETVVAESMAALKRYNSNATKHSTKQEYGALDDMMMNMESRYPARSEFIDPATAAYRHVAECMASEKLNHQDNALN